MFSIVQLSFFSYILGTAFLVSCLFSLISFIIVTKRLSFLAIGTEHASFGGMGLARILNTDQFLTSLIFCSIVTVFAGHSYKKSSDIGMSLMFSAAMAFGLIMFSLDGGKLFNIQAFLFGDLISVSQSTFWFSFIIISLIFVILIPNLNKIIFVIFDPQTASVSGINIKFWDTIIYIILSISIMIGIKLVGVLLVASMTVLPAAYAFLWQKNIIKSLGISLLFTVTCMFAGIFLSFYLDISPGAVIVALSVILYFFTRLCHYMIHNLSKSN